MAKKRERNIVTKTTAFAQLAPRETVNNYNVARVSKRIKELTAEIISLSTILKVNNKQKRDYTCPLSDSCNIKRGHTKKKSYQAQNKKRKKKKKNDQTVLTHKQRQTKNT